jgi:hypothetical protein
MIKAELAILIGTFFMSSVSLCFGEFSLLSVGLSLPTPNVIGSINYKILLKINLFFNWH